MPFFELEAKLLLALIARRYSFRTLPDFCLEVERLTFMAPKGAVPLRLIRRDPARKLVRPPSRPDLERGHQTLP
jgi:hypothetical protein